MSLIWHIVKKDFRRLAVPLALWALLLIARGEVGAAVLRSHGINPGQLFYWSIANTALIWMDGIVAVLLVAALVHEDALVGTGAAWVTRPLSGARLLAAKLLGAALMFGVLPIVVALRWWMVCGYGVTEMAQAALAIAVTQSGMVFTALALAVVTRNINEFLGWTLGLIMALIAWRFMIVFVVMGGAQVELSRGVRETQAMLFAPLVGLGGASVIAIQFFARHRRWALRVAAVGAGLLAILSTGKLDLSSAWARAPRTSPSPSGITITVENPKIDREASMDYVLRGVPPGFGARVSADHAWRWSDGSVVRARATEIVMQANAVAGPKRGTPQDSSTVAVKYFVGADKAEAPDYAGELQVALLRPKLEFELPLREGEKREQAGVTVRIDKVIWREGVCSVTLVECRPIGRESIMGLPVDVATPATSFTLANQANGEAVKLRASSSLAYPLVVGRQGVAWLSLQCDLPRDPGAENSDAPPAWLKDATLAVIRYHEEASFDREVRIEKFGASPENAAVK